MYLIDTPLYVGTLQLHNRLVLPPMASGKPDEAGHVTDGMLRYYCGKVSGRLPGAGDCRARLRLATRARA